MFCILFTMCTYPSQSVKISIHSCTFSKNFPIRRLMPFQYIPFFLMLIYLVIYFVINSCANTPSAQYICKNTKNIQKSDFMDGFCWQGELDLTLFYKIEGYFDNPKSLMTLMILTLMTGILGRTKRPLSSWLFSEVSGLFLWLSLLIIRGRLYVLYPMQLVTPSVVAIAVRMLMAIWRIVFQVFVFIFFLVFNV